MQRDELADEVERLREEVERLKDDEDAVNGRDEEEASVTRRDFLKKLGLGAASLGVLGLTGSASALKISTSNGFTVDEGISVGSGGNLDLKDNNIVNSSQIKTQDIKNTRNITVNGTNVTIGHRVITSSLPLSEIKNSDKIDFREGDVYQQIQ